jgi:hypothetical protein
VLTGASAIAIALYFVWHDSYNQNPGTDVQSRSQSDRGQRRVDKGQRPARPVSRERLPFLFIDAPVKINPMGAISAEFQCHIKWPRNFANAETHWKSTEANGTQVAFEDHLNRFSGCAYSIGSVAKPDKRGGIDDCQVYHSAARRDLE